jgi:hypothetical protein
MEIFAISKVQLISIIASIAFFIIVVELIRREKIQVQYALLWLFFSIVFMVLSFWRNAIEIISTIVGIAYSPTAFILILLMVIVLILIQYSIVISKLSEKNKILVQEVGILKAEVEEMKQKLSNAFSVDMNESEKINE